MSEFRRTMTGMISPRLAFLLLALGVACGGCRNDGLTWSTAQAKADSLLYHGNYREGLAVADRAVELAESAFGADDRRVSVPLAIRSCAHLSFLDYPEAMSDATRSLKLVEQWGNPHDTLLPRALVAVATVHQWLHHYDTARAFYQRLLGLDSSTLGPHNPYWHAWALIGLGDMEQSSGSLVTAENYLNRASDEISEAFGPDNELLAGAIDIMARVADDRGDVSEALHLDSLSLGILLKSFGQSHCRVALRRLEMGRIQRSMRRYREAELLFDDAIESYGKAFGPEHPRLINPLLAIGRLYEEMGRIREAESAYRHAIRIADTSVARSRHLAVSAYDNLAWLRQKQKAYQAADSLLMRSLKVRMDLFGKPSDEVAEGLRHLGRFYLETHDYGSAEIYLRNTDAIGPWRLHEREQLAILSDDADLLSARHNYDSAEQLYREVIDGYERNYGASSTVMTSLLNSFAEMYRAQGKYPQADSLYRRSIAINSNMPGGDVWQAHGEYHLAQLRQEEGNVHDADELFRRAILHYSDAYGPHSLRLPPVLDTYAKFLRATGRAAAADSISAVAGGLRTR
ncbi:MAG: Tfp pilus assembly protein PilF [Chlorobi bacterium]|nr:Tfp pilus assembly protein PilF [Chlorobiota bacterium]